MLKMLLEFCAQLDKFELLTRPLGKKEILVIQEIAAAVGNLSIELYSEKNTDESLLAKDIMQCIRQRVSALAMARKFDIVVGTAIEFSEQQAGEFEAQYRADIGRPGVWAGLTEASHIAVNIIRVQCHIYTIVGGKYKRVITIGRPTDLMSPRHLLHTGNHYQVLKTAVVDGSTYQSQDIIPIAPDGDCLFESILVLNNEPLGGKGIVRMLRSRVARGLSTQEVVSAILAIVWQGDHGGLGPNMSKLVRSLATEVSSSELDDIGTTSLCLDRKWIAYLDHFHAHFRLTRVLNTKEEQSCYLLTNVGTAQDWYSAFSRRIFQLSEMSSSNWGWLKGQTTANYTKVHPFTHLGVMWATIKTVSHGQIEFVAAAANYYWSEVETLQPWIYYGTNNSKPSVRSKGLQLPKNKDIVFGASDMHSECFCFFYLSQWLTQHFDDNILSVKIRFFLEKPMCDRCQSVCGLFLLGWQKTGIRFDFETDTVN